MLCPSKSASLVDELSMVVGMVNHMYKWVASIPLEHSESG